MSFFRKLGETALNTANTIGAKSADLVELGKLKLAKSQLEGKIEDSKIAIGHIIYEAYKNGTEPASDALQTRFNEITDMENQIKSIDDKIEQDRVRDNAPVSAPAQEPASSAASKFCSNCGAALTADAKFCGGCGKPTA